MFSISIYIFDNFLIFFCQICSSEFIHTTQRNECETSYCFEVFWSFLRDAVHVVSSLVILSWTYGNSIIEQKTITQMGWCFLIKRKTYNFYYSNRRDLWGQGITTGIYLIILKEPTSVIRYCFIFLIHTLMRTENWLVMQKYYLYAQAPKVIKIDICLLSHLWMTVYIWKQGLTIIINKKF